MTELIKWVLLAAGAACLLLAINHRAVSGSWRVFTLMMVSATALALVAYRI